jgi:hypothetical protein
MSPDDAVFWTLVVAQARSESAWALSALLDEGPVPVRRLWEPLATLWRSEEERDALWADLADRLAE